ncbi:hypothetical protein [Paenibacillus humicola]|uniref:hypothetical protein n=1 Tax=Paenibacillus humicola TaxID=3110540 RepID=UPI00237C0B2C|nr:hypothetical protein [Paenibacillus humicola]
MTGGQHQAFRLQIQSIGPDEIGLFRREGLFARNAELGENAGRIAGQTLSAAGLCIRPSEIVHLI